MVAGLEGVGELQLVVYGSEHNRCVKLDDRGQGLAPNLRRRTRVLVMYWWIGYTYRHQGETVERRSSLVSARGDCCQVSGDAQPFCPPESASPMDWKTRKPLKTRARMESTGRAGPKRKGDPNRSAIHRSVGQRRAASNARRRLCGWRCRGDSTSWGSDG